jgi:peptidyl-prolyl cis-trans isomerase A (cyclophilin A)
MHKQVLPRTLIATLTLFLASVCHGQKVVIETDLGKIEIQLFTEQAPKTTANFLEYVGSHFYDGTIFHRVIDNFMAQGGGLRYDFTEKETREPVINESDNGLRNTYGTVAMARFSDPDSATSQFFVNLNNNGHLDPRGNRPGYTVFGEVTNGMHVVHAIAEQPQGMYRAHPNAPNTPIRILKAYLASQPEQASNPPSSSNSQ